MRLPGSLLSFAVMATAGSVPGLGAALAQTGPASAGEDRYEAVIVTARRRQEAVNSVPETLTVFQRDDIDRIGISNLRDVANLTPNFTLLDNYRPGLERFQIRGLISPQVGEPPLALLVDGITAPDTEFINQNLFDIARIEVLRGPQGAIYGRSAVGGAINIVTVEPTAEFQASLRGSLANGATHEVSGTMSGPLVPDKLRFRVGGYYSESDGLIENAFAGEGADASRQRGIFAQINADLAPATRMTMRAQYSHSVDGIGYYNAATTTRDSIEDFSVPVSQNVLGDNEREVVQISSKFEHDFEFATLSLAGGFSKADDDGIADGDIISAPSDGATFFPNWQQALDAYEAWTAEGRLTSSGDGRLSWALGSFFQDKNRVSSFSVYDDPAGTARLTRADLSPALLLFAIMDDNSSRSWALSAETTYAFTDKLSLSVAGRFDEDHRRSVDPRDIAATLSKATFSEFQPKVSVSYRAAPNVLAYAGYSRGFRSGGFNEYSPVVSRQFEAEITDSYELGVKSSAWNGRLTVDAAVFRNEQDDAQFTRFNPASFTLENVGIDRVRSQGAEIEVSIRPVDSLHVRFGAGFVDSEIEAFARDPSLVGSKMPYVSDYNSALMLDYEEPVSGEVSVTGYLAYRTVGPRSFNLDFPDLRAASHEFVDLRAGLRGANWRVTAFAENLFDERQPEDVFGLFNGAVELARQPNRPRKYGIELRRDF
ncbi:TonB-dependent receptor [Hyphomonas sp.]|uniref:TonB-dependent receptor n=1 Tax=Hyphomonas sp. TaxID=87 RepID=UPI001D8B041B|nr:TonB-dependent receptor [Hyphomonas sp.]MBU4061297.1 TonB-dependent receptor [Alphaproteobacteria bacterium]MBU4162550.1 TonB-dependent receptor [Alphaproteobacteria bacterium]